MTTQWLTGLNKPPSWVFLLCIFMIIGICFIQYKKKLIFKFLCFMNESSSLLHWVNECVLLYLNGRKKNVKKSKSKTNETKKAQMWKLCYKTKESTKHYETREDRAKMTQKF